MTLALLSALAHTSAAQAGNGWLWVDRGSLPGNLDQGWFTAPPMNGAAARIRLDAAGGGGVTLNATIGGLGVNDRLYTTAHGSPGECNIQGNDGEGFAAGTDPGNNNVGGAPYAIPAQANITWRQLICNSGTAPAWAGGITVAASAQAGLGAGSTATGPNAVQSLRIELVVPGTNARQFADITDRCNRWARRNHGRAVTMWFENTAFGNHGNNVIALNAAGGPVAAYNAANGTAFAIGGVNYIANPAVPGAPPALLPPSLELANPHYKHFCSLEQHFQSFAEAEPNGIKDEATLPFCMTTGDYVRGMTTGNGVSGGDMSSPSADTFRITTCEQPPGIYRHRLTLATGGAPGHTGQIRGLSQSGGVPQPLSDVSAQASAANVNQWYGFGGGEQIFYRVSGTPATTAPYSATLTTTSVTPIVVTTPFVPGAVTISSVGQTGTDTDLWVYDWSFEATLDFGNDDASGVQSSVTRNLSGGTYYVAISDYDLANERGAAVDDNYQSGGVLDFEGAILTSSAASGASLNFSISDGLTSVPLTITKSEPFEVVWVQFTVGAGSGSGTPFCFGDGTGTACPCGNAGAPGNGCANSLNANGANLTATGQPSIAADTFVLEGSGMPNGSALYFQGTAQIALGAGVVFGDGLRCAGGPVLRFPVKTNAAGASHYPGVGDVPISVLGANSAGGVRTYQCWYRNAAAFCTPSMFNLTNGFETTWLP